MQRVQVAAWPLCVSAPIAANDPSRISCEVGRWLNLRTQHGSLDLTPGAAPQRDARRSLVVASNGGRKMSETNKKPGVRPPPGKVEVNRRQLLGSTSFLAASVLASTALPRSADA